MHTKFHTIVLRKFLVKEKKKRANKSDEVKGIDFCLGNEECFEAVCSACCEQYERDCCKKVEAELKAGKLTDFLDWLLENADEIIALIMKLMDLFSETGSVGSINLEGA